jgi:type IV pilus assembly protein PilE
MLIAAASQQEQYFLDNKTYTSNMTNLGFSANPASTKNGHYLIQVQAAVAACASQTCYVLKAIPQNTQASDSCGTLTLDSSGAKLPADCW